jgi:hypothetical protein
VWQNGDHFNMLLNMKNLNTTRPGPPSRCNASSNPPCYNISTGWAAARFQTRNTSFEQWDLMDRNFHESLGRGSDSFFPLVHASGAKWNGSDDRYMLNTGIGEAFTIGRYDKQTESFVPDGGLPHVTDFGNATWFASGPSTKGRTVQIGWLDTLGGGNNSQLSCVRSLSFDAKEQTLLSNPVEEYEQLRHETLASVDHALFSDGKKLHVLVEEGAASSDLDMTFELPNSAPVSFGLLAFADGFARGHRAVVKVEVRMSAPNATDGIRAGFLNVSTDTDTINASGHRFGGCTHHFARQCAPGVVGTLCGKPDAMTCGGSFKLHAQHANKVTVRALLDRTTVEVFVAGGRAVVTATSREGAARKASGVALFGSGGVSVNGSLFEMGCGWLSTPPSLMTQLKSDDVDRPAVHRQRQMRLVPSCLAQLEKDCGSPLPPPAACFACIGRKGVPPVCKTARQAQRICNGSITPVPPTPPPPLPPPGPPPRPSVAQLKWLDMELGTFFHYTMYTFVSQPNSINGPHEDCGQVFNRNLTEMPAPSTFNPSQLSIDQWMKASVSFGAKYAILVAKHGDGFITFPT